MKRFVKLMLLLLVTAIAAPFVIKGQDGKPLLDWNRLHFSRPAIPQVSLPGLGGEDQTGREEETDAPEVSKPVEVFKWQDAQGGWHYSDQPQSGVATQTLTVDPNTNLQHYHRSPVPEKKAVEANASKPAQSGLPGLTTVPLAQIPKLIQDAKDVGNLASERQQRQEHALQE